MPSFSLQRPAWMLLLAFTACPGPQMGTATLDLAFSTKAPVQGSRVEVVARATRADGQIGTGDVSFVADQGAFEASTVAVDSFGSARTTWRCDACLGPVLITVKWEGVITNGTLLVSAVSGNGGGTATGGGTGTGCSGRA